MAPGNAVWDGTDAVMLSGEAASGKFPCEAVLAEAAAAREVESASWLVHFRRLGSEVEHRIFPAAWPNVMRSCLAKAIPAVV